MVSSRLHVKWEDEKVENHFFYLDNFIHFINLTCFELKFNPSVKLKKYLEFLKEFR